MTFFLRGGGLGVVVAGAISVLSAWRKTARFVASSPGVRCRERKSGASIVEIGGDHPMRELTELPVG